MGRMLTAPAREAQSLDWVARFDAQGLRGSGAASPVQAARNGRVVLFDGVLYDRSELERTLGSTDGSDAALILTAFERWGQDFLHHLRGLFAVIVWDGSASQLIAARD